MVSLRELPEADVGEFWRPSLNRSLQVLVFLKNENTGKTFAYAQMGRQQSQVATVDD